MTNECKGCRMYDSVKLECKINIITNISATEHCPCINCLVKGMCNSACEDFKNYSRISYRDSRELHNKGLVRVENGKFVRAFKTEVK